MKLFSDENNYLNISFITISVAPQCSLTNAFATADVLMSVFCFSSNISLSNGNNSCLLLIGNAAPDFTMSTASRNFL